MTGAVDGAPDSSQPNTAATKFGDALVGDVLAGADTVGEGAGMNWPAIDGWSRTATTAATAATSSAAANVTPAALRRVRRWAVVISRVGSPSTFATTFPK